MCTNSGTNKYTKTQKLISKENDNLDDLVLDRALVKHILAVVLLYTDPLLLEHVCDPC